MPLSQFNTKHLHFEYEESTESGKTHRWVVRPIANPEECLGHVHWWAHWRRYVFRPYGSATIFDPSCMNDIAKFCDDRTKEQRGGKSQPYLSFETRADLERWLEFYERGLRNSGINSARITINKAVVGSFADQIRTWLDEGFTLETM